MASNKVVINGNLKYEVPDSFMPPLMEYLKMVKGKTKKRRIDCKAESCTNESDVACEGYCRNCYEAGMDEKK